MSYSDRHSDDFEALALGKLLRNGAKSAEPAHWEEDGLDRLLRSASLSKRAPSPWQAKPFLMAAAACVLVVGGVAFGVVSNKSKTLSFEISGSEIDNRDYVVAPVNAAAHMKFSDGSNVDLTHGARLRVQQVTDRGASLVLERGSATTHVVHRANTHWKLFAGQFEISVIGTRFQVDWEPSSETLKVDLFEGTVQIGGSQSSETAVLKGGQRFVAVGSRPNNWSIAPIAPAADASIVEVPVAPLASVSEPAAVDSATPSPQPVAAAPTARTTTGRDWAAALAKGDFSKIVAEAEARGINSCLEQCSTGELRYLADAARYTRHFELAEQTLLALRRRSPGEAANAAYLLGALNESQGRSMAALRWYDQSAAEAPVGRYISEVQAGRLRMLLATNQRDTARALAERYLNEYPRGVGVPTAKTILDSSQ